MRPATIVTRRWPVTQIIDASSTPWVREVNWRSVPALPAGALPRVTSARSASASTGVGASQGSSRALFRLWGQPAITENEAPVEAVDLHVGHWTGIELGRDWTRVYLRAGSCGNTVSRRGRVLAQVADQADDVVGDEPPDGTA